MKMLRLFLVISDKVPFLRVIVKGVALGFVNAIEGVLHDKDKKMQEKFDKANRIDGE